MSHTEVVDALAPGWRHPFETWMPGHQNTVDTALVEFEPGLYQSAALQFGTSSLSHLREPQPGFAGRRKGWPHVWHTRWRDTRGGSVYSLGSRSGYI